MDSRIDQSSDATMEVAKPRGRPFEPGQSGNPSGRPKGARNKATLAIEALIDDEAEALTRKVVAMALDGNVAALRLCVERLLPPRRDRAVAFDLPKIETAADAVAASGAVLQSCAAGILSPGEAADVMGLIATHVRAIELHQIEAGLSTLEAAKRNSQP
ncbi:MAG TPA: DUF5681 domain-containing protein [Xanthobacteraceae bacterium]|nr:DUF5681 domain-containing protein [Xanthobacteraceae bacterium]